MNLRHRLFNRNKTVPVHCEAWTIVELIQECMENGTPILKLNFLLNGEKHCVGIESDFSRNSGFFDTKLYLDTQRFDSLSSFIMGALIDGVALSNIRDLVILRDWDTDYSWVDTLLVEQRMI